MPVPRAAAAELGRIPLGLRPGPFSFRFQGGPSSYEQPPGALGTGPERAAVWGDRRCGGGSSRWWGVQAPERPLVSTAHRFPPPALHISGSWQGCGGVPKPRPISPSQTRPPWAGLRALSTVRDPRGAVLGPGASAGFLCRFGGRFSGGPGSFRQTLARLRRLRRVRRVRRLRLAACA